MNTYTTTKNGKAIQAVESMKLTSFIFPLLSLSIINYNVLLVTLDHVSRRPTTRLNTKLSIVLFFIHAEITFDRKN